VIEHPTQRYPVRDTIPSSGGAPELVVEGGYAARFSPDGKTLVIGSAGKLSATGGRAI
jgi:hypothetical protein